MFRKVLNFKFLYFYSSLFLILFLLLATNSILLYTSFMSISFYSLLPEIHFFSVRAVVVVV